MKYKCLILDDEPLAVELIENHISNVPELELAYASHNPVETLTYLNNHTVDLAFFDIQMPLLTGIELVKNLKNPPPIIFTTAYRDFAVESYELDIIDYLVKPITFSRFLKSIQKFKSRNQRISESPKDQTSNTVEQQNHLFVNVGRRYEKINYNEITYIEGMREYVRIHTKKQSHMTKISMTEIEKSLPQYFLRVHRSFIVNINQITAFTSHDIEIGKKEIPIGGSFKNLILKQLKNN